MGRELEPLARRIAVVALVWTSATDVALAAEIRVRAGEDIQPAIDAAMPGDVIVLEQGSYSGPLRTARDATADAPIVLRGERSVTVTATARVLDVQHAYFHVENVVFDAQFADDRVMRIDDGALGFRLVDSVVRNARRHCIDIRNTRDVVIDGSLVHHCLAWNGGRQDAHGISAQSVQGLVIRDTEIHTFTGDAFQVDPSRSAPGWTDVLIEGCTFWLAPVTDGAGGVPMGIVPGENAVDTKTLDDVTGRLSIRDTVAYGFRDGEIGNMAAFNIKENVDVEFDGVTVYASEIAFRLRGSSGGGPGAKSSLTNVLVYDVERALRVESDIERVPVHHVTFGADIVEHVDFADGADASDLDAQNVVVLGEVPPALAGPTSVTAVISDFVDVGMSEYAPVATAPWLDSGADLGVTRDLRGAARPQGGGPDPGAYEYGDVPAEDMGSVRPDDAGSRPDGGAGGTPDGGANAAGDGADGPGGVDGGASDDGRPNGCSCSSGGSLPVTWYILFAVWFLARRGSARSRVTGRTPN